LQCGGAEIDMSCPETLWYHCGAVYIVRCILVQSLSSCSLKKYSASTTTSGLLLFLLIINRGS